VLTLPHVEVVPGDLKDPRSLHAACAGVTSVVAAATAMRSGLAGDTLASVDDAGHLSLIAAAEKAGARHFVYVSIPPLQPDSVFQRIKRRTEDRLRESSMTFTVLQSAPFLEAWLSPAFGFDPVHGRAVVFGEGTRPVSWISVVDVARFASKAVDGGPFAGLVATLGGPEALSPLDAIRVFREEGAPEVVVEHIPEAALEAALRGAGTPTEEARAALALAVAHGLRIEPQAVFERLPGRMTSVRDFARRQLPPPR
jgi:uncharacterized protein YbjT (DUF2867 family)